MSLGATPSKKRKHLDSSQETLSVKKPKKEKKDKKDKIHGPDKKGKSRAHPDGEFRVVQASLKVSIPPIFASNPLAGVEEMLDSLVMRYVPAVQGVVLCYSNVQFPESTAVIKWDRPFANCTVRFDATVWSPQIGMKLTGKINLCSPDHISLLVHSTFNVSIPRLHIPTDHWEFAHGPAENDPEFGYSALTASFSGAVDAEAEVAGTVPEAVNGGGAPEVRNDGEVPDDDEHDRPVPEESGSWIHKITEDRLGGKEGLLEFTVIRLTIANQMLSLVGSLQSDPFSPRHNANSASSFEVPIPGAQNGVSTAAQMELDSTMQDWEEEHEDTLIDLARTSDEGAAHQVESVNVPPEAEGKTKKKRKKDVVVGDETPNVHKKKKKSK